MPRQQRLKPGTVLEVETPAGRGYIQFIGSQPREGDVVRIFRTLHPQRLADPGRLESDDSYFIYYPAPLALRHKLITAAGHLPLGPHSQMPTVWRRHGLIGPDRRPVAWLIDRPEGTEVVRRDLTPEEARIPIAQHWNHEALVTMLTRSWTPETETEISRAGVPIPKALDPALVKGPADDAAALSALGSSSDLNKEHQLKHHLYFQNKSSAQKCAADLNKEGFSTTVDRSATGKDWLVLARHSVVPRQDTVKALRAHLDALAGKHHGEYDGWEAEVVRA